MIAIRVAAGALEPEFHLAMKTATTAKERTKTTAALKNAAPLNVDGSGVRMAYVPCRPMGHTGVCIFYFVALWFSMAVATSTLPRCLHPERHRLTNLGWVTIVIGMTHATWNSGKGNATTRCQPMVLAGTTRTQRNATWYLNKMKKNFPGSVLHFLGYRVVFLYEDTETVGAVQSYNSRTKQYKILFQQYVGTEESPYDHVDVATLAVALNKAKEANLSGPPTRPITEA